MTDEERASLLALYLNAVHPRPYETILKEIRPMPNETPEAIGERVGRAIARDVLNDYMPQQWTGLDAQDGDKFTEAGILIDTPEWDQAEAAARRAFYQLIADYHGD